MRIIDLLNKIANGEIPKKIKYKNHIYDYYNGDYREFIDGNYDSNWLLANEIIDLCNLCDEVEILDDDDEEKGLPEKLFFTHISDYNDQSVVNNNFNNYFKKTQETINQLIEYLEKQR